MEAEKKGIKEVLDLLKLVDSLTIVLLQRLKDGIGMDDAAFLVKLSMDEEFKLVLKEALSGMKEIPEEIKDIDVAEGIQIAMQIISNVPKYLEAVKK